MLYLDSGVFIYAALSREPIAKRARQLLQKVKAAHEPASSSALSFDVVWAVQKHRSRDDALAATRGVKLELREHARKRCPFLDIKVLWPLIRNFRDRLGCLSHSAR